MPREIERKYLVTSDRWRALAVRKIRIRQAYLCFGPPVSVRIRQKDAAFVLTLKGKSRQGGLVRTEVEKPLTEREFHELWEMHRGVPVEKIRYLVPWKGGMFEVDEFITPRPGLVLAEWESHSEQPPGSLPGWIGDEVTGKAEYYNSYMARHG